MKLSLQSKVILGAALLLLMFGWLFIFFMDGLFIEGLAVKVRTRSPDHMLFTGWPKQLLCISGVLLSTVMLYMPLGIIAMKLSIFTKEQRFHKLLIEKLFLPMMAVSFSGIVLAYIWQGIVGSIYV